jgi:hypothetical protein
MQNRNIKPNDKTPLVKAAEQCAGYDSDSAQLLQLAVDKQNIEVLKEQRELFVYGCVENSLMLKSEAYKMFDELTGLASDESGTKVEINVRSKNGVTTDKDHLNTIIEAWSIDDTIPPLFAWAEAFNVQLDELSVLVIKRANSRKVTITIDN